VIAATAELTTQKKKYQQARFSSTKTNELIALTALLLMAAALRIIGINYGQPDMALFPTDAAQNLLPLEVPIHPDEVLYVSTPLELRAKHKITPEIFENPLFFTNLNLLTGIATGVGADLVWEEIKTINGRQLAPFDLYVVARWYSMLGGMLVVAATYGAGRVVSGRFAALTAGLIAAVSLPLVQHAHYATTSSMAAGFAAVSLWATLAYAKHRRGWLLVLAGAAAGLAGSNRYNAAAVALIPFALAVIGVLRWKLDRRVGAAAWIAVPLLFLGGSPQILRDFGGFWNDFQRIFSAYSVGDINAVQTTPYGMLFEYRYIVIVALGIPAALLTGIGAAVLARRAGCNRLVIGLLALYVIPYSLVVLRTAIPAHADQLQLPVIPVFALLTGVGAAALAQIGALRRVRAAIPVLLVLSPLLFTVPVVTRFAGTDTRLLMSAWITANVPEGARIHLDGSYNVPLDQGRYQVTQSYGGELPSLETLCAADYVVLSDAWYHDIARAGEIINAEYRATAQMHLDLLDRTLIEIARIPRPALVGNDMLIHTASSWHDPGLIVYAVPDCALTSANGG